MPDKREEFISLVKSKLYTDNTWTCSVTGYDKSGPWCSAFVWACAITTGIQNVLIAGCASSALTVYNSTKKGFGVWLPGPAQGSYPTPQVGDLYTNAGNSPSEVPSTYGSCHIGVVVSVSSSGYSTIDGNLTNTSAGDNKSLVRQKNHTFSDSKVKGFFRPNWSKVGVTGSYTGSGVSLVTGVGSSQYAAQFEPTDSMIREVGYMNSNGEPSVASTDIRLSAINYTPLLSEIVSAVTPTYVSYSSDSASDVSGETVSAQGNIVTKSGKTITSGKSVVIPASVSQTGIVANFTNYTKWYGSWASGTVQKQLSQIWNSQGKPSSHRVATISGYYLVALSPKFGTVGDIVTVVLADGTTFNAILGDAKGPDATSEWGHVLGSGVDIVEWEAVGTESNSTVQSYLRSGLESAGFYGKKVSRIINYGSWING